MSHEVICPYCVKPSKLVDSKVFYRVRSYGLAYYCQPCAAWVGCHKGTNRPLGRLANKDLRKLKQQAHSVFDPLWRSKEFALFDSRNEAYAWLAGSLKTKFNECHIGMFSEEQCRAAIKLCLRATQLMKQTLKKIEEKENAGNGSKDEQGGGVPQRPTELIE